MTKQLTNRQMRLINNDILKSLAKKLTLSEFIEAAMLAKEDTLMLAATMSLADYQAAVMATNFTEEEIKEVYLVLSSDNEIRH